MRALGVSGSFHILSKSLPATASLPLRSAVVSSRLVVVVGTTTTPQTPDTGRLRLGISRCQLAIHNTSKLVVANTFSLAALSPQLQQAKLPRPPTQRRAELLLPYYTSVQSAHIYAGEFVQTANTNGPARCEMPTQLEANKAKP
jgi:hypothetical protein